MHLPQSYVDLIDTLLSAAFAHFGHSTHDHCPPFNNGTFTIHEFQLYPENADWDTRRCLLAFGAVFNASVAICDPYEDTFVDILTFPGITNTVLQQIGGITWGKYTGLLFIVVDADNAINTGGADVSGNNYLMKYGYDRKEVLWTYNLTQFTGGRYGGFQDVITDARGYSYVGGTYPSSIVRISPDGKHGVPWYVPPVGANTTLTGFAGIAAHGDVLLTTDNNGTRENGQIYRFDLRQELGEKILVPRTPDVSFGGLSDALHMPPKYGGTVALVALDLGEAAVLRSKDGSWRTAQHLGTVPLNASRLPNDGGIFPATVQIGRSQYLIVLYLDTPFVPGTTAGNRTDFPIIDITSDIEELLAR